MNAIHNRTRAVGILLAAAMLVPACVARAQPSEDQELAARRQAILQQEQLFTEEGEIIYQDETKVPPPQIVKPEPAAPSAARTREPQRQTVYRPFDWRGHYYGDPNVRYYYGPPRGRYYARYPGYYYPYNDRPYYGDRYYHGTPRFGYDDYPYNGAARVGRFRFYWR
ncbi:MAG: hypothetical protein WD971_09100 [Pirellulales bacterium]